LFPDRADSILDTSHDFLARITHSFSERVKLDVRDRFRYSNEPGLFDSGSTLRRDGTYINNSFTMEGEIQWLPKFGTITTYSNDFFDYFNKVISRNEDRLENSVANDLRFQILPTTNFIVGGSFRNVDYFDSFRDSNTFTGYVGADHSLSPTLLIGGRVGASYLTLLNNVPGGSSDYFSPYGTMFLNWKVGAKSTLDASYAHEVSTTDASSFYGQESDKFSIGFRYQWTPKFSNKLQFLYNLGNFEQRLGTTGITFEEDVAAVDLSGTYQINNYLDVEAGYTYTSVINEDIRAREYDRNRVYIGIRGTY
jgi:hypothetical protein